MRPFVIRLLLLVLVLLYVQAYSTHLKSIQIRAEKIGDCNAKAFSFELVFYINMNPLETDAAAGGGTIDFGDGESFVVPELPRMLRPDIGEFVGTSFYTIEHTYAKHGVYKINYTEHNRNQGILNLGNAVNIAYTTFTEINTAFGCNQFPRMLTHPVDNACSATAFYHSPGAVDGDGDSLHFEFVVPLSDPGKPISDYSSLTNPKFYSNFQNGNEDGTGPPTLSIDPITGLIIWNAPGNVGQYLVALKIEEWRIDRSTETVTRLSTTIRDMIIVVNDCDDKRPILIIPNDLCVTAGTEIVEQILGKDPGDAPVKVELFSDVFQFSNPPMITPAITGFRTSVPADTIKFKWKTDCSIVRDQPYQITIKITNQSNEGFYLVTYKTWKIKVIAPAIIWKQVNLDLEKRKSVLEWEPYGCVNVDVIQVWRKVDHYNYNPDECSSGIPKYLGYQLIAELNPAVTQFVDDNSTRGLVRGALYCYRLVAVFSSSTRARSYVSTEQCLGPIKVDAPVITNVSIEETGVKAGVIRVSWRSPFEIDKTLFPEPYKYEVYRAFGFESAGKGVKLVELPGDTTFIDAGINTRDSVFNYQIVVYAKPPGYASYIPVDTSAVASSVRLIAEPGNNEIQLSWMASVPWSNTMEGSPYHLIFRGLAQDKTLQFFKKVDVTENGFSFADRTIEPNTYYCYTVMTRGTYGNPKIDTLRNFSQRFCTYPINDLIPCAPLATIDITDCNQSDVLYNCDLKFENSVRWRASDQVGCREDIIYYKIYASSDPDSDFELVGETEGNEFIDSNLPSFARCYKIAAVDSRGVESEAGTSLCNDNCPHFTMPNIFTPGNSSGYNDDFRSYTGTPEEIDWPFCNHFILQVRFQVFNRWGKRVYSSSTTNGLTQNIDWNGKDSQGKDLEGGIYYYQVDVDFDAIDSARKFKTIKGWVQLVR